ncbi:MAG: CHAT domain-containing protein [Vicinamibacterales bacterium]|nr:CHAT domain-containing protein [Vicinamibacterales bacterium]
MMDPDTHCPDPELLSAYLDAGLDPAAREAVVHHLAECDRCRRLIADVVRTQDAVPAMRTELVAVGESPSRLDNLRHVLGAAWTGGGLAGSILVVALAMLVATDGWVRRQAPEGHRARLAEASGRERTVEARLSGPFPYAPLRPAVRSVDGDTAVARPWMLVAAAGEIREAHHADLSAASQHATGVAALLVGEYHEAIRALTAAADIAPQDAAVLADLAAAYHERARLGGRPDDLPRALSAAERAIAADPSRAEAWFNRALAIAAIAPRDLAREAWQAYLAHESNPEWRAEAEGRLQALMPVGDPWPEVLARLQASPSQADVDAAVRQHTSRAREFLERDLFPAWATATLNRGDATTPLATARMLADAFARLTGDQLGRDVVVTIDRAEAAGGAAAQALAAAIDAYAAVSPGASVSPGRSPTSLLDARKGLRAAAVPLELRAAIDLASADYYRANYKDVEQTLAGIEVAARRQGYGDVLGQVLWLGGMAAFAQGRLGDAQFLYEQTLETVSAMGDAERMAGGALLLANLFYYIGDEPHAWQYRTLAASSLSGAEATRVRHGILLSAAGDMLTNGLPEAALVIQSAASQTGHSLGAAVEVEALAQRARIHHAVGQRGAASQDLRLATERLATLSDPVMRRRVETSVLAAEAELFGTADPPRAIAAATEARQRLDERRDRLGVAQLSVTLATAFLAQGMLNEAERHISAGIAAFDDERASMSSEGRISYSDRSWALFEQAIQLALARGDRNAAFNYGERGRARTVVEAHQWSGAEEVSLPGLAAAIPEGTAVLILNQFQDELVSWLVHRGSISAATVPVLRDRAVSLAAAYSNGITTGTGGTHASGELFDALIRPHLASLRGARLLVIVPDGPYSSLAFAGLHDRRRGRYLIEDMALTVAPSATVFVRATERAVARPGGRPSALIIGAPSTSTGARLAPLPGSRDEAAAIAAIYGSAELRAGVTATPDRLLDDGPGRDVVHVAAHGMTNAEYPMLSRLMLADAPGRPYSGAVFAREVAARDFSRTGLVVLASCDSGGGPSARGEGALSLARAFLAAGAPTVVSALGPLDDTLARQMFVEFHRAYARGASAAESLQQVQVQALQRTGRQPGPWARLAVFGASHTTPNDPHRGSLP